MYGWFPPPSGTHVVPSFLCAYDCRFRCRQSFFAYVYPWAAFLLACGAAGLIDRNEQSNGTSGPGGYLVQIVCSSEVPVSRLFVSLKRVL